MSSVKIFIVAAIVMALSLTIAPPSRAQQADNERHVVFAHYMICFTLSKEFCKQEIELAQRYGIDGFALNCGAWGNIDEKTGTLSKEPYIVSSENMYQAARELGTGFKLFFSADVTGLKNLPLQMGDMVQRFYDHPNQFRYQGKAVISAWSGTPESFAPALNKMKADGYKVCFVPFVFSPSSALSDSFESFLQLTQGQAHLDGLFYFAAGDNIPDTIAQNALGRRVTQYLGKLYMAGACPAYNSGSLRDFHGVEGYGAMWEGIIRDDADWVEITTWNDYNEDSNLMAYRWKNGIDKDCFDRDESMLDATAYYSAWFKAGVQPKITQDKLYYAYRNRSRWLRNAWDAKTKQWVDDATSTSPYEQVHDDVGDFVYVTTFLTAPAELTIRIGSSKKVFQMPVGIGHAAMPMSPGVPHFSLLRKSGLRVANVLDVDGRKQIISEPTKENSRLGNRLNNRLWTGGAAAGKVTRIEAATSTLTGGASVVRSGAISAVKNLEQPESGFTANVTGLATVTYSVRIIYSNPAAIEARLTLIADGVPRAAGEYPYYFPVFLPPTGKDRFSSVSFLWSLYDTTHQLSLQWKPGVAWDRPLIEVQDVGSPLIQAVELVKVAPVVVQPRRVSVFPEMVLLPGGTFTMGSKHGPMDEMPVHQVTVSSFAMGKYEITNEEYEKFDPTHKQFRGGFSWRNREPVLYVSSTDGASYCNWLSKQAGLTPVYDEKTLEPNLQADGFRLPTEAEWEYAASGRGEGRQYPWGNKPPDATHGNFGGTEALDSPVVVRSEIGRGTVVVGSYPAGASRDGIMDLAGNVSEWCQDWYQNYTPAAQKDPCNLTGYVRVVRGGSWGYTNGDQRCASRDSNKPWRRAVTQYGLRVVVPEAGYRKLTGK